MHLQCLAVAGLLANAVVAGGQRHERIVHEGYVYKGRDVESQGTGASTAHATGPPPLPSGNSPSAESSYTRFQYAPTTATVSKTTTSGSASTASVTLRTTLGTTFSTNGTGTGYLPSGATGTGYASNKTSSASLCTGQTLNVLGASLDWWYAETYTYVASIFSVESNGSATSWSVTTPSTSFDITSALASPSCQSSLVYNPTYSTSLYASSCSPTPRPVAASTIVITQTAYGSIAATTGTGEPPNMATQPTPAAVTVASQTSGYSAGVPFVFFSAYEIMSKSQQTHSNGSVDCAETTQRVDMLEPFSFEFTGGDANGSLEIGAHVTGDVNPAFLGLYSINAVAGSWVAKPTVVVVLEKVLAAQSVLGGETQVTATSLMLPSPTLPYFTTPDAPASQSNWEFPSPVVQSSATEGLIVPTANPTTTTSSYLPVLSTATFIALMKTTEITFEIPVPATQSLVTTTFNGQLITATALSDVDQQTDNPVSDHTTHDKSTALTNTSPSNALEVLTAALSSQGLGSAILAGLGVSSPTAVPEVFTSGSNVTPAPLITVDSTVYRGNAGSTFTIDGSVLTPGGSIILTNNNGKETISLDSTNGNVATFVDGTTMTSAFDAGTSGAPILTVGGKRFTAVGGSTFIIMGHTLTPGGVETVTMSGHSYIVSLSPQATDVQILAMGSDGQATATAHETLFAAAHDSSATTYTTVDATASQGAAATGSGASATSSPTTLYNDAQSISLPCSGVVLAFASLLLAVWL